MIKLSELEPGMMIILDDGFTCHPAGTEVVVQDPDVEGEEGLYFPCDRGCHYLHGQKDKDGWLVGVELAPQFRKNDEMTESAGLVQLLEEATEGSRELDWQIHMTVTEAFGAYGSHPHYTTSLDAALTLVGEGVKWKVGDSFDDKNGGAWARVGGPRIYDAASPALALCIAALKARQS